MKQTIVMDSTENISLKDIVELRRNGWDTQLRGNVFIARKTE